MTTTDNSRSMMPQFGLVVHVLFLCILIHPVARVGGSCAAGTSLVMAREAQEVPTEEDDEETYTPTSIGEACMDASVSGILTTILIALAMVKITRWIVDKMQYIQTIEKIPGPSLQQPNDAFVPHPWLAHLGFAVDLSDGKNPIPGYPGLARSFYSLTTLHKQFQNEGIFRLWMFNPFRLPFLAQSIILVTDVELVRQVLVDKSINQNIIKHPVIYRLCDALVGGSFLAMADTPRWKHQRKLIALGMHHSLLEHTNDVIVELLYKTVFLQWDRELLARNNNSPATSAITKEAGEWCTRLVSDILGIIAFSRSFRGLEEAGEDSPEGQGANNNNEPQLSLYECYRKMNVILTKRSRRPPFLLPFYRQENKEFNQCEETLNTVIETIVGDRVTKRDEEKAQRAKEESKEGNPLAERSSSRLQFDGHLNDLLSYLMMEDDNDNEFQLSKAELSSNVRMLLFAGQDTTAIVLSHALYDLATHPNVQKKLQEEVDSLFTKFQTKDDDQRPKPAYKDIMRLEYLDAVCKEALRLHAPAGVARQNVADITLTKGTTKYHIPAYSSVYVYPVLTGQGSKDDATICDNLEDFVPERFLRHESSNGSSNSNSKKPHVESFSIPFSVGPRNCVGQPLAMAELKVVLAHLVHRYNIRKTENSDDPIKIILVTIKAHQIMLDFERRQAS